MQENTRPAVDQRVDDVPGCLESNLQALEKRSGHQTAFAIVGHGNMGKQITIESISLEFQEQVGFLTVEKIFLVESSYVLKS